MQRACKLLNRCRLVLVSLAWLGSLSVAQLALAQEAEEEVASSAEESWTLAYAFVVLALVFGLFLVCRPAFRKRDLSGGE